MRDVVGQDARALLPGLLSELAASIAWPKSQRWGWSETTFVRPVQWLVAIFGGEVVPLQWAGHTAGRHSKGHRFLANGPVEIANADGYVEALRAAHVVVDPEARKDLVLAELSRLERETGMRVRRDDALVGEVIHLGEYPVGVAGEFDPAFLGIPEEIVVTSMRNHQRYFAMESADGKLANRFATMMATIVKDPTVVTKGNQKVLASRLTDGKFFVSEDRKKSFEVWNGKLDSVVFQAKLGDKAKTIGDKVRRLVEIATKLAAFAEADGTLAAQAAAVCKADLASLAVGEFPELQGVMGRHYAKDFGLSPAIATAIDEHWWPKGQGAALPATETGAILALADRMDTIVGCFAVGLAPSGSADPFGLRRAAIGIWQILLSRPAWSQLWTPLFAATQQALAAQGVTVKDPGAIEEFFRGRLRGILIDDGLPAQEVDAALAQSFTDPVDARERARALMAVPREARIVFKRIANILDDAKAKNLPLSDKVDTGVFQEVEARLWNAFSSEQVQGTYPEVIQSLVRIQPQVAAYFDKGGVMVMDPDPALRTNRLTMLSAIFDRYVKIGDFRVLAGAA